MNDWQGRMFNMFNMFNNEVAELQDAIGKKADPPEMNMISVWCKYCDAPNAHVETIIDGVKSIRPLVVSCDSCGGQFDETE